MVAEAVHLALNHSERTITAETPSEYDLGPRIQAQIAMIQRAIELSFLPGQYEEGIQELQNGSGRPETTVTSTRCTFHFLRVLRARPILLFQHLGSI